MQNAVLKRTDQEIGHLGRRMRKNEYIPGNGPERNIKKDYRRLTAKLAQHVEFVSGC